MNRRRALNYLGCVKSRIENNGKVSSAPEERRKNFRRRIENRRESNENKRRRAHNSLHFTRQLNGKIFCLVSNYDAAGEGIEFCI